MDTLQEFAELLAAYVRGFDRAGDADEETVQLTAQVLLGGLTEALIAWLEGRLHVSREKLVEHCAALWIAAAHVPATLKRA